MTYGKLIELYKKNMLKDEQKTNLERDIEKQEAISNYLFDRDEQGEMNLSQSSCSNPGSTDVSNQGEEFTKKIQISIRNTFLKMGIITGTVVIMIVLFIIFALPQIVNLLYYNPSTEIAAGTNQLSLDMAVYTELFIPGYNRDTVTVEQRGYGNYDINVIQNASYNGVLTNISGKIERGKLHFYNDNILKRPVSNCFASFALPAKGLGTSTLSDLYQKSALTFSTAAGTVRQATNALNSLNDYDKYVAYVTLNQFMSYEDFINYFKESENINDLNSIWCAVCTSPNVTLYDTVNGVTSSKTGSSTISDQELFKPSNIGFNCTLSGSADLNWDRDQYPYLRLWDSASLSETNGTETFDKVIYDSNYMQTHFVSMLQYMAAQKKFLSMMDTEDAQTLEEAASYVNENGLIIYGFACIADKKTLLKLNEQDNVFEIYTQILQ